MERKTQINVWYMILAVLAVVWLREAWVTAQEVEPLAYNEFLQMLEAARSRRSRSART